MSVDKERRSFEGRVLRFAKKVTHADLVAASNGLEQNISLGTLPGLGFVLGSAVKITTFFTGGAATAVTLALGTTADPDSIMTVLNVFDTTTTGIWLPGAAGVTPRGPYGGVEIFAQFDVDAGHTLLALTAGELDIEVIAVGSPDLNLGF